MPRNTNPSKLLWLDMEMTGLDPEEHRVLEIAVIVTDIELNTLAEGPVLILNQSETELSRMDDWNTEHHTRSGLVEAVRSSTLDEQGAARIMLDFVRDYCEKGEAALAGNSIHVDKAFLRRYLGPVNDYLHYRIVDVSSIKTLAHSWYPNLPKYKKSETHRALDDIKESIAELEYYRSKLFVDVISGE